MHIQLKPLEVGSDDIGCPALFKGELGMRVQVSSQRREVGAEGVDDLLGGHGQYLFLDL